MKRIVVVLHMLCLISSLKMYGSNDYTKLNMLDESHIIQEQEKLSNQFFRTTLMRYGLTGTAAVATCAMLYWWSKGDVSYSLKDEKQAFLEQFSTLPDDRKYEFLMAHVRDGESLSWRSLARRVIPYALGTAASNIVFNSLQMMLMQPLSKMINTLYFPVALSWFYSSQTNTAELFEALRVSAEHLDREPSEFQETMLIDLMNSLTFQVERVIAFMQYQLGNLDASQVRMRPLGTRTVKHLKTACAECINVLRQSLQQRNTIFTPTLMAFKNEFEGAVKQFQAVEKVCM